MGDSSCAYALVGGCLLLLHATTTTTTCARIRLPIVVVVVVVVGGGGYCSRCVRVRVCVYVCVCVRVIVSEQLSGLGGYLFDMKQPTQNWHGPGESDCLIKTKHCDVC